MKSKKYLAIIALILVCITVCSLFAACELFAEEEDLPQNSSSGDNNNESQDQPSHSSDNNPGDGTIETPFDPLDPTFVPDIDKTYIINPVINNQYDGINRYIGEYDFSAPEQINVSDGRAVKDVIGAGNYYGKYSFTSMSNLVEGAEMTAHDLGSSVYKLLLGPDYAQAYSINTKISDVYSLAQLASTSVYSQVFSNPDLDTFIIYADEFNRLAIEKVATENRDPNYFYNDYISVTNEFYDLTKYLLTNYKNKTFILSTHDCDKTFGEIYNQCTINGGTTQRKALVETMYRYLNARQDGINKAVAEVNSSKTKVYGCIEVNYLSADIPGVDNIPRVVDEVIPHTRSDLYALNDEYAVLGYKDLISELNHLLSKAPNPNADFDGKKNVILSGISCAANDEGDYNQFNMVASSIIQAVEWGVQYAVYDSYYCNERLDASLNDRPTNGNMAGRWLICPDGSYSTIFWYLKGLNDGKNYLDKTPQLRLEVLQ